MVNIDTEKRILTLATVPTKDVKDGLRVIYHNNGGEEYEAYTDIKKDRTDYEIPEWVHVILEVRIKPYD